MLSQTLKKEEIQIWNFKQQNHPISIPPPLQIKNEKRKNIYISFYVFQNFVNQYASSKNKVIEMVNNINAQICQTVLKIERQ